MSSSHSPAYSSIFFLPTTFSTKNHTAMKTIIKSGTKTIGLDTKLSKTKKLYVKDVPANDVIKPSNFKPVDNAKPVKA